MKLIRVEIHFDKSNCFPKVALSGAVPITVVKSRGHLNDGAGDVTHIVVIFCMAPHTNNRRLYDARHNIYGADLVSSHTCAVLCLSDHSWGRFVSGSGDVV